MGKAIRDPECSISGEQAAAWEQTPLGRAFLESEEERLHQQLRSTYPGQMLVISPFQQIGHHEIAEPISVGLSYASGGTDWSLFARAEELPVATSSMTTVISAHVHEYTPDIHRYLRELDRVVEPEGLLIIAGFNPFNLVGMGMRHRLYRPAGGIPFPRHFVSVRRIKDWLKLLDYELEGGSYFFYRPFNNSPFLLRRLAWLEHAGDRWWPIAGAGYVIKARKRVVGMTGLLAEVKRCLWRPLVGNAVAGAAGKYEHR